VGEGSEEAPAGEVTERTIEYTEEKDPGGGNEASNDDEVNKVLPKKKE